MIRNEIFFNNKYSYTELGLTIKDKNIETPSKRKIKKTVPYMDGTYDFSLIYGDQNYEERNLTYIFNIITDDRIKLESKKSVYTNWLMNSGKTILKDNLIPGYYFLAEVENISFERFRTSGELEVKFISYPFKISIEQDGHDIWDEFNFELDIVQDTKFEVDGIKNIELYNNGAIGVNPAVICSTDMEIIKGNITFEFKAGESKSWSFKLDKGLNNLTIKGTGTIEFKWYKEVL